ncbi:HNH endonuclease signature motif containing protein [Priestia sp. SB1]|uniref:HNH endonuclease n=1 Tax=Priestia sp. SB1 TaxID=3132359 RepID=UPI00317A6264
MKECSRCNEIKPLEDFYQQKKQSKKRGNWIYYHPECKECNKKAAKKWYQEHPEIKRQYNRNWNKKPDAKIKMRENSERRRKEGLHQEWIKNNPDKMKKYAEQHRHHETTEEEWEDCKNYFNYRCAYCSLPIEEHWVQLNKKIINGDFHKEHVHHDGENDLSNCVPACKTCNVKKYNFRFEEWYNKENEIFSEENLEKIHNWLNGDHKLYINIKVN